MTAKPDGCFYGLRIKNIIWLQDLNDPSDPQAVLNKV